MIWTNKTERSFSESFFSVFNGRYFLFQHGPLRACKRLLERKAVTLCDKLTEHKAVSQKSSFQFLTEEISFITLELYVLPNMTLQIPQEQSQWAVYWGESCNCVRWINRTQSSFSESFFSVFILGYIPFRHNPLSASNITLQIPQGQSQWTASWRESCNCVRWINEQSSFSESFFSVFILGQFLFHHSPIWASKYPYANSTRTALAKGFWKGKM